MFFQDGFKKIPLIITETMNNIFSGWFQKNTINNYRLFRLPFWVNKNFFDKLFIKHYSKEFKSKYNSNLFVDQDKNAGKKLLNEILLNQKHFGYLSNELRILNDWIEDFVIQYTALKSLLDIERITVNRNSIQYKQLEMLLNNSQTILGQINEIDSVIHGDINLLPISLSQIYNTGLTVAEGFDFKLLDHYEEAYRFIENEPTDTYQVAIVFRRLSEIVIQISSVNRLVARQKQTQVKFVHGNAGMGKSNFSAFLYTELRKQDKPSILISGKSFSGDPHSFDTILMKQLRIPVGYDLEEVLEKLNSYGLKNGCRVSLIFDGLNETSSANYGFSQLWQNNLDNFIEKLHNYPYLYLVATLRSSYVSRIWNSSTIPYEEIYINGFSGHDLRTLIILYFTEFKIDVDSLIESDVFYFRTPLFLDLYCKMLNSKKEVTVKAQLGLEGFKQVFENYLNKLVNRTSKKLGLITKDQVLDGIDNVSKEMLDELNAFVPALLFYEKMQGEKVTKRDHTIGEEILQEYLIYLNENRNNRDVIEHTQQEVGGYLLAKKLIKDNGSVDSVVQSDFFQNHILGVAGHFHQLKDDILKFLITESDVTSLIFQNYIGLEIIKKYTLLNLQRTKQSKETQALSYLLKQQEYSKDEIRTLLNDASETFYDPESNINFLFIKDILLKVDNYKLDFAWSYYIYNNYYDLNEFVIYFKNNPEEIVGEALNNGIIELTIWLLESTIRDLRDKSTKLLIQFFVINPEQILVYLTFYSATNRVYINERLALVCYGICLRLQNEKSFINNQLGKIANALYTLQFTQEPSHPTYNYIVIDSYKHIIDLAILKGVFELDNPNLERLANYKFNKDDWFEINENDRDAISTTIHWSSSPNPDPLAGDFVHYTIPRLDNLKYETRTDNTANIYKEILRLGYIGNDVGLSEREQSFYRGTSLLGSRAKVDRLGKKYSWMAYFNYAGYLLSQNKLDVWQEENSEYKKHYERLSDTEIEPSYDKNNRIKERVIQLDFFVKRKKENNDWVNKPNYDILKPLYTKGKYTLLSAFIDQKLDENYKTRSWVQAHSFFVNKTQILEYIHQIENREFDWNDDLNSSGSISNTYFGELYWADTIPSQNKDTHNFPIEGTIEIKRRISPFEVQESGEFNFEDIGKEITEIVSETCSFEYEQTLIDFLWETDSKEIPSLRCDIPAPNLGKNLSLTVDSSKTKILDSDLEICFQEYYAEYGLNSENFHYFRTDLLEKYLIETNQLLMYQLKQQTYDQAANDPSKHFRGMQFVFSSLNR